MIFRRKDKDLVKLREKENCFTVRGPFTIDLVKSMNSVEIMKPYYKILLQSQVIGFRLHRIKLTSHDLYLDHYVERNLRESKDERSIRLGKIEDLDQAKKWANRVNISNNYPMPIEETVTEAEDLFY